MQHMKQLFITSLLAIIFLFNVLPAFAQASSGSPESKPKEEVNKARVLRITEEGEREVGGQKNLYQKVDLQILEGPEKDKTLTVNHGETTTLREEQKVKEGQTIVLLKTSSTQNTLYQIVDVYRLDKVAGIAILFFAIVILVSRLKGLGAIVGLAVSLLIITNFIVPTIIAGDDPLVTSIVGSFFIMVITMYVAHGFTPKTHVALMATCIALVMTGILAYTFVNLTSLTGFGSDDATSLSYGPTGDINFQGLLLGGIIIGSLGVLDDITTSMAASIQELARANSKLQFKELVTRGMRIGSDHIASLVNTLALAYAGAALPLFLFLVLNPADQPLWFILNSELIVEEIVRTLAGSIGLILAVPLTAVLAAWAFQKKH
ncbi:MAG: YibE/F family protein [Candidatus Levybacteria bacterium]|nr:YibE/F family protein [Candidatus Levybacteria bacterium]